MQPIGPSWLLPWRWVIQAITFAASVVGLVMAWSVWSVGAEPAALFGLQFLAVLVLVLLGFSIYLGYQYSRKARYAEALVHSLAGLRQLTQEHRETERDVGNALGRITGEVAQAFTLITGTRVSACVKRFEGPRDHPRVETLCRDRNSESRYGDPRADDGPESEVTHFVDSNTAFRFLVANAKTDRGAYYINNNLPRTRHYHNTSMGIVGQDPDDHSRSIISDLIGPKWSLPYKSTLIVPIKGVVDGATVIEGFMCLDSKARRIFNRRYDPLALSLAAEAAYPLLRSLTQARQPDELEEPDEE